MTVPELALSNTRGSLNRDTATHVWVAERDCQPGMGLCRLSDHGGRDGIQRPGSGGWPGQEPAVQPPSGCQPAGFLFLILPQLRSTPAAGLPPTLGQNLADLHASLHAWC